MKETTHTHAYMSLGFNQNRKHRTSTLPGTVNAATVRESPRRSATTAAASVMFASAPAVASTVTRRRSPSSQNIGVVLGSKRPPSSSSTSAKEIVHASHVEEEKKTSSTSVDHSVSSVATQGTMPYDEAHVVYATVTQDGLMNSNGAATGVEPGQRVVLVYPMTSDGDDGIVTMKMKSIHKVTGQLSYTWVRVYDPNTETRYVTDFSLLP